MDIIQKLTNLFSDFPTVGPRTAQRFVYYLMKQSKERIEEITNAILELKSKIKFCSFCLNPHEPFDLTQGKTESSLCPLCSNYNRNKNLLCIVEKEQDLISIATNPTPEGINASVLVERILKETKQDFVITHLARGIPVGGELEYADEETLESAFEGRK